MKIKNELSKYQGTVDYVENDNEQEHVFTEQKLPTFSTQPENKN